MATTMLDLELSTIKQFYENLIKEKIRKLIDETMTESYIYKDGTDSAAENQRLDALRPPPIMVPKYDPIIYNEGSIISDYLKNK
jgi:hypothetical protein